ncbi:MAG: hypothetical protein MZV70_63045 [Desulfobacterales bacterium]|nr:hypothetical protein [Desulfobacterales bacterium]
MNSTPDDLFHLHALRRLLPGLRRHLCRRRRTSPPSPRSSARDPGRAASNATAGCPAARYLLAQRADGYCIFWDRVCTHSPGQAAHVPAVALHRERRGASRPTGRSWPAVCPGMRTDVAPERVRGCVKQVLAAEAPEPK